MAYMMKPFPNKNIKKIRQYVIILRVESNMFEIKITLSAVRADIAGIDNTGSLLASLVFTMKFSP